MKIIVALWYSPSLLLIVRTRLLDLILFRGWNCKWKSLPSFIIDINYTVVCRKMEGIFRYFTIIKACYIIVTAITNLVQIARNNNSITHPSSAPSSLPVVALYAFTYRIQIK